MMRSDIPQSLLGEEFATPRREFSISAECEHQEKMLHKATSGKFEFYADEPPTLGGTAAAHTSAPIAHLCPGWRTSRPAAGKGPARE